MQLKEHFFIGEEPIVKELNTEFAGILQLPVGVIRNMNIKEMGECFDKKRVDIQEVLVENQ